MKKPGGCPGCDWGTPPELWPVNGDVFDIWREVKTQFRVGFGLVGLDYSEVRQWADDLQVELTACNWRKIKVLENWYLAESRKKPEDKG